jgi:hypothetical protein
MSAQGRRLRTVLLFDAMAATLLADMLAQELTVLGSEKTNE